MNLPINRARAFAEQVLPCESKVYCAHMRPCPASNRDRIVAALLPVFERGDRLLDACKAIYRAVEANAAPINVIYALQHPLTERIDLDPELLVDLFEAIESVERERGA